MTVQAERITQPIRVTERSSELELYECMLTIRRFEEKVKELAMAAQLEGAVHVCIGQEAVAAGACAALRKEDPIIATHRGHGHCIAKGQRPDLMMAELMGRATGYCKGKGGSMHIADFSIGMLGATAVVGAGIPIASGAGLSIKLRGTDQVAACLFGEGASNQGTFHEGINLAATWGLPVIFVCENNLYAMGTHQSQVMLIENVADRAQAYGIPGVVVDGNDVLAVYEATEEAVQRARTGKGPTLVECKTYRHKGHSRVDPATYRPKEEVGEWIKKDPIERLKKYFLETHMITEEETRKIETEVVAAIDMAVKFALESPYPALEEALEDVYA